MEKKYKFWDVIIREDNALKPLDERFKVGNLYESHTMTDEASAESFARLMRNKYPNADIQIKYWECN